MSIRDFSSVNNPPFFPFDSCNPYGCRENPTNLGYVLKSQNQEATISIKSPFLFIFSHDRYLAHKLLKAGTYGSMKI